MVLVFITGGETVKIDIKIDASWSQKFDGTNSLLVPKYQLAAMVIARFLCTDVTDCK